MKVTLIGAGSFVFGGTVLRDALERHHMAGELALVDLNLEAAEAMAGVGRRMARGVGADCEVWATDDRREALPGSDAVILSAAPQGARRWTVDYEILTRAGMPDQVRECGGLGGLSYALRTISLALDLCDDMETLCPDAVLLDVTNPMPRVVTAIHRFTKIQPYGFCNASQRGRHGYDWLAGLVDRPADRIDVVTAGLNHFTWVVSVRDAETGEDLLPAVEAAIRGGETEEMRILSRWLARYGAVSAPGVSHAKDYLPTEPDIRYATRPPFHGTQEDRAERVKRLRAVSAGELDWRDVLDRESWEHPVDLAMALDIGGDLRMPMVNLPNHGYLTELSDGRIVEVPVLAAAGAVRGEVVGVLPGRAGEICKTVSDVNELVAEGAATGSREVLQAAVETDPAVGDKAAAMRVLDEMIAAHRDLLPRFEGAG